MTDSIAFFDQLKTAAEPDWTNYIEHQFVREIATGELSSDAFKHYLQQDYLFLIQFIRVWGLAIYKSHSLKEMRAAQSGINALLDKEIDLHISYCHKWGISEEMLLSLPESTACIAYTRYVLDAAMSGDLLALHCAVSPCMVGYAEVGKWITQQNFTNTENNPYQDWINTYASESYQHSAKTEICLINELGAQCSDKQKRHYQHIFKTATRLEISFWQMGLAQLN